MKVKGESFTETLKTLRRGKGEKQKKTEVFKRKEKERKQKARKKSLGGKQRDAIQE